MKRMTSILAMLTMVAALGGMLLSLTINSGARQRAGLSNALVVAALAGFAVTMATRGLGRCAETVGAFAGDVGGDARPNCTFANVAANEEALQSLSELRDYLKDPEKFLRYGARMPKGVLLYGPPGTGKTLLARALAGEAGVPFFVMSGSDFVEKYVGVGASRVRELFRKARKAGRCVVFIDEIDALGKRRDEATGERDQTLNALLSEMSGFHTGDGVVVIAATNRIEAMDPALLRPGRFDRQIEVGLPGRRQRLSILRLHSAGKPMEDDVSLEELASQTVSFSGASLENLLNEAALRAAIRGKGGIGRRDLQDAFYRILAGADQPATATEAERRIIAVHEAGHAVAGCLLAPENRLARVSILPSGRGAAGYNLCVPEERVMPGKAQLQGQLCVLLAGRAAEELFFGEDALTGGASGDLARATELAAVMVTELGMAGEPAVSLKVLGRYCGVTGVAELCRTMLAARYEEVKSLLSRQVKAVRALSEALLEAEALEGEAVARIVRENLSSERRKTA